MLESVLRNISVSAKLSGMFCPITSISVDNEEVKFSKETRVISRAKSGFPKIMLGLMQ